MCQPECCPLALLLSPLQALLAAGQQSALHAQQEHYHRLTAAAAAAVDGSIEAALEAAHRAHQERVRVAVDRRDRHHLAKALSANMRARGVSSRHTSSTG